MSTPFAILVSLRSNRSEIKTYTIRKDFLILNSLKKKKLFLFDIDGTLAIGDTLLDGSRDLLEYIDSIGGKSYFITNNSTKSSLDYVNRFREVFRLHTTEDRFITSGYMTKCFLTEHYMGKKIFVMGTRSFVEELKKSGLTVTEKPEEDISCVVVAYDSELTYEKLIHVSHVLFTKEIPFYATNPDLRCPIDFGFVPDCGAICDMITATTGKAPIYLGKPNATIVSLCLTRSGFTKEQTLVVGDRLYTDIACGINGCVDTCAVLTGESRMKDLESTPYRPTFVFEDIKKLLAACKG